MRNNEPAHGGAQGPLVLTRFDIDRILHFIHPIPLKHGWHQRHLDDHHPGWEWGAMIALLRKAEVLIARTGGLRCHWKLKQLTYTAPSEVQVEWDPDVTADDGRFYSQGEHTDFSSPSLSTVVAEALGLDDDGVAADSALVGVEGHP